MKSKRLSTAVAAGCLSAAFLVLTTIPAAVGQPLPDSEQRPRLELDDGELDRFVAAMRVVQDIQLDAQQRIERRIATSELEPQRFQEIHVASINPQIQMPEDVTGAERAAYDQLLDELIALEQETQQQMQSAVHAEGFVVGRFNEIATAVQQDDVLFEQYRRRME